MKSHSTIYKDSRNSAKIQPPSPFVQFFNDNPKKRDLGSHDADDDNDNDDDDDDDDNNDSNNKDNDEEYDEIVGFTLPPGFWKASLNNSTTSNDSDMTFNPGWNSTFNENDPDLHLSDTNSGMSTDKSGSSNGNSSTPSNVSGKKINHLRKIHHQILVAPLMTVKLPLILNGNQMCQEVGVSHLRSLQHQILVVLLMKAVQTLEKLRRINLLHSVLEARKANHRKEHQVQTSHLQGQQNQQMT